MVKRLKNYVDTNEEEDEMSNEYSDNQSACQNRKDEEDVEIQDN